MKKLMILGVVVLATCVVCAQSAKKKRLRGAKAAPAAEAAESSTSRPASVQIDEYPKLGRIVALQAPVVNGASNVGTCYTKQRKWLVLETKYSTQNDWTDQLTFTWHVLLETKTATENKGNRGGLPPYSYFTTTTTYINIPKGSHAASVCLHPSYYERFGEPRVVGLVVTDANGEVLAGDTKSDLADIKAGSKFWEESEIMNAKDRSGEPMIERRQGLLDRSKTIWALVNPNDYEMVNP